MSRAAGPAACAPKPPCATSTTTTTFGLLAGAHDAYQEWSLLPIPDSAVPVLPATGTGKFAKSEADVPPGECAAMKRPCLIAQMSFSFTLRTGLNVRVCTDSPRRIACATCGRTTVPPFTSAEYAT